MNENNINLIRDYVFKNNNINDEILQENMIGHIICQLDEEKLFGKD